MLQVQRQNLNNVFYCLTFESGRSTRRATVSPHVNSITERLQIDGQVVTEQVFCDSINQFIELLGDGPDVSYFEFMIVFVLWVFSRAGVDYAVVETGLGGLHDGTNVCRREDKICVITDIGYDHQHVLGNTIVEIAGQKIGIAHNRNHVFTFNQSSEIIDVFEQHCSKVGATLHVVNQTTSELTNSVLVRLPAKKLGACEECSKLCVRKRKSNCTKRYATAEFSGVSAGYRMQLITFGNQKFILDGAHNAQKMSAFVNSFLKKYPKAKVPILLAMKDGKDYPEVISLLSPIMLHAYCVSFSVNQDMHHRSVAIVDLLRECSVQGVDASGHDSIEDALKTIYQTNEPVVVVTGSFYLLGDVIRLLNV